jgi:hypothetical protein
MPGSYVRQRLSRDTEQPPIKRIGFELALEKKFQAIREKPEMPYFQKFAPNTGMMTQVVSFS